METDRYGPVKGGADTIPAVQKQRAAMETDRYGPVKVGIRRENF